MFFYKRNFLYEEPGSRDRGNGTLRRFALPTILTGPASCRSSKPAK